MALTASETFGTIVPGFVTDTNGNLSCTGTVSGSSWREGFLRDTDGRLVVTDSATGATWQNGFLRGTSGELVYTLNSGDYGVVPGFKTATNGALCFSVEPSSQAWQNGFLVSTSGYLAATGVTPYAVAVRALSPSFFLSLGSQAGLTDLSGNGRNGTGAGSITIGGQTGPLARGDQGATAFDGSDDWITATYNPWAQTKLTFGGWVRRSNNAALQVVAANQDGTDYNVLAQYIGSEGTNWTTYINKTVVTWASSAPAYDTWTHWMLVYDDTADTVELFVNGVSKGLKTGITAQWHTGSALQIGRYQSGQYYYGNQAWFSVFEKALSSAEILALYNAGAT